MTSLNSMAQSYRKVNTNRVSMFYPFKRKHTNLCVFKADANVNDTFDCKQARVT